MSTMNTQREAIREGAAEVKDKLKSDLSSLSKWARVRRFVSLSPTMVCLDCDGRRQVACGACGGSGKQKVVWNDEETICEGCQGKTIETCSACSGRGRVKNVHRKKFLWMLGIGGLGWAYVLFQLWGHDVLPEQSAKYLHGGGGGGRAQTQVAPRSGRMTPNGVGPIGAQPGPNGNGAPGANGANGAVNPGTGNGIAPGPGGTPDPGLPAGPRGGRMAPRGGGQFSNP